MGVPCLAWTAHPSRPLPPPLYLSPPLPMLSGWVQTPLVLHTCSPCYSSQILRQLSDFC